ncbi:BPSL0761 family protein [Silanimonas sp.]|uniref:BPSL0761 family protein n=1 Tax=Silanimonas sp. TaxID=1929290 RepID=UPI0022BD4F8F|nr:BPSL0761 family protein [Silanimonas sp.]MCZ8062704.1 hypothetical protein [Silanimonas sp.]
MTTPLERSLSVLWTGGLLIRLSGDRRVPIELRRIATSIARHFPSVEDVEHAATLSLLREHGHIFEHPRNCPAWQEKSPGPPLTRQTRLNWPSGDADDGIDGDAGAPDASEIGGETTPEDLREQIESVNRAQDALTRRRSRLAALCMDVHTPLIVCFHVLEWNHDQIIEWINRLQFDDNTKNVAHLLIEERRIEINERLRKLTHENPVKWRPLDWEG